MSVYVCSDIHGQYDLYLKMLRDINFSNNDVLYILGDIIDRGLKSIELLLDISNKPNIISLIGNHELMMWDYFKYNEDAEKFPNPNRPVIWTNHNNGGLATLSEFEKLNEDDKNKIFNYIENLYLQYELNINNTKILLSHSDFISNKSTIKWKDIKNENIFDIVWQSPWRFWEYQNKNKYLKDNRLHIIGHVPTPYAIHSDGKYNNLPFNSNTSAYIDKKYNIINIDCGCAFINEKYNEWNTKFNLCCMNLSNYFKDSTPIFTYYC